MKRYYKLLKDMPYHAKDSLLNSASKWYIWETGPTGSQYSLPAEVVENCPDWFEEVFPNWIQNEPCWFLSFNGMVVSEYFDRDRHSSLARCGNLFKSHEDAEMMNVKVQQIFQPFADESI